MYPIHNFLILNINSCYGSRSVFRFFIAARQVEMLLDHHQALVPYTAGTIQMVPGASGYVLSDQGRGPGDMELAYSSSGARHNRPKIQNEKYETTYTWNRRPASFGRHDVGSFIDIYA
jgi:hypothetical protein